MKHISKSNAPKLLEDFKERKHTMWKEIHDERNKYVYDDCLTQCELDQDELCGYTEIPLSSGKKHIDHYVKLDIDPNLTFMEPSDCNDTLAENTITMFNLNDETLKNRRANSMTLARSMFEGGMDKDEILCYLASDGFISAIEYELSQV